QNILTAMFSTNDEANIDRYEQLYFLLNDLTFWGKGSGAVISGYSRNVDKPYGFELSYLNLVHKVGVMAIFVILAYASLIIRSFSQIAANYNTKYAIAALGAMTYLFIAIGNPLLFAPQSVLLHCCALYFLRDKD